ncbi:hypothetical protein GCM10027176_67650 [Actinoallomurus bryophytorum]|uniref:hypothetical protein n=1 Tax=Actinoallomurus bryophytorum TaxID=1490222 RepID=UPI001C8AC797|nr:hypothetical protein [Actinoallomurus bryophytorum]
MVRRRFGVAGFGHRPVSAVLEAAPGSGHAGHRGGGRWHDYALAGEVEMADQEDVRRIALSLPGTVEDEDRFAFSVLSRGKNKGIAWVWLDASSRRSRVSRGRM